MPSKVASLWIFFLKFSIETPHFCLSDLKVYNCFYFFFIYLRFIHPSTYLFPSCNAIRLLFLQDMKKQNAPKQPMKPILFLFEEENCEFLSAPLKKARNLSEVERPKGYVRFSKKYLRSQYILEQ